VAALANETSGFARTEDQTTPQGYFQFCVLQHLSGQACRLPRALTMNESSEKDYCDAEKFIIEVGKIPAHKSSYNLRNYPLSRLRPIKG
jgi:hypothetical protein